MKLSDLYHTSPYDGLEAFPKLLTGWNSWDKIFQELIQEIRPTLYCEVGVWRGASIIHAATLCKQLGLNTVLLGIDTFLGAIEFWKSEQDPERDLQFKNGYPQVYYQFLSNVVHTRNEDCIIPFPQTSLIAARWLAAQGIKFDIIYIDASHDYDDVMTDLKHYYPLVRQGGAIFGDDADTFVEVQWAVRDFCKEKGIKYSLSGTRKWVIRT